MLYTHMSSYNLYEYDWCKGQVLGFIKSIDHGKNVNPLPLLNVKLHVCNVIVL